MNESIIYRIDHEFGLTFTPTCVITKDYAYRGFFETFHDSQSLRGTNQFRFVLWQNSNALREELDRTEKLNPVHSIILNADEILDVKHCMSKHGAEALRNAALTYLERELPTPDRRRFAFKSISIVITINSDEGVKYPRIDGIDNREPSVEAIVSGFGKIVNLELFARLEEVTVEGQPDVRLINLEKVLSII